MFWGLIMEPQRRYTQQVKKAFHISMAALDLSTSSEEPAQVMCGFEGRNYLLCTLKKPDVLQCPLDLNFDAGSEVSFAANGKCHVHLTGYLTDDLFGTTEEESDEEQEIEVPKKRTKKPLENGPPNKKTKTTKVSSNQDQNADSDSDDSEVDVKALLEKSLSDSDDDDSDAVEDEDDDEEDDEESEEEEEDSFLSEGESDEKESESTSDLKVNGVPKKKEQETQKQKSDKKKKENQNKKSSKNVEKTEAKTPNKESHAPRKRTLQGGVVVEDVKEGQGPPAKNGKFVSVYYEGRLKQNNKLFDATNKGSGFSFRLGSGEVIKGWDIGVLGMKPGGKRKIICPPAMAYGQKGSPPAIPPNSTLVFEVELKKIS